MDEQIWKDNQKKDFLYKIHFIFEKIVLSFEQASVAQLVACRLASERSKFKPRLGQINMNQFS